MTPLYAPTRSPIIRVFSMSAGAVTIVAHTASDGVCFLMSTYREGCGHLQELHHLLSEAGSLTVEDFAVINEFGVTPRLELATFRPRA